MYMRDPSIFHQAKRWCLFSVLTKKNGAILSGFHIPAFPPLPRLEANPPKNPIRALFQHPSFSDLCGAKAGFDSHGVGEVGIGFVWYCAVERKKGGAAGTMNLMDSVRSEAEVPGAATEAER